MPLTMQAHWYGDGCSRKGGVKHISEFLAEESASVKLSKSPLCFEKGEVNSQNDGECSYRKHPGGHITRTGIRHDFKWQNVVQTHKDSVRQVNIQA